MIYKKNSNILLEADELLDPWLLAKTPTPLQVGNLHNSSISQSLKEAFKQGNFDMAQHPRPSAFPLQLSHFEEPGVGNMLPA